MLWLFATGLSVAAGGTGYWVVSHLTQFGDLSRALREKPTHKLPDEGVNRFRAGRMLCFWKYAVEGRQLLLSFGIR